MKDRLLIIDGSCLLTTNYYGNLHPKIKMAHDLSDEEMQKLYRLILHNNDGKYTNAIYGFFKTLVRLLNDRQDITHIAFVFDKSRETLFRREMYPPYKAQRKPTPEPLREQFISIENSLHKMGFPVFYMNKYEADDIAGTIVSKFEKDIDIVLMTKDRDYLQLVSDTTKIWMMMSDREKVTELREQYCISDDEVYPEKIFEFNPFITKMEEGVWPEQIPDLKGLMGDSSDNIPGVKNLSSAAAPLLSKYGTIESLYAAIDECEKDNKKIKELSEVWKNELNIRNPYNALTKEYNSEYVKNAKESALLSKTLATIKKDIPLDIKLEDLRIRVNKDVYKSELDYFNIRSIEPLNEKYFI